MLQDIAPKKFDNSFVVKPPVATDRALYYDGNRMLMKREAGELAFPTFGELAAAYPEAYDKAERIFAIDDEGYYLLHDFVMTDLTVFPDLELQEISIFRTELPRHVAFAGITARHLRHWLHSNRYCGGCAAPLVPSRTERAMVCPSCGLTIYPRINPAVIVAVTDGDRLLMARGRHSAHNRMALIAGFVEFGETFEEAVAREVREEVGLSVKNVRYYKSQPWGFSDSVMIGFFAELDGDDTITIQESELLETRWFDRADIPHGLVPISIAYDLVEHFRNGNKL